MRINRSLIFYSFLACLWLAISGWQVVEHYRFIEFSRNALINRTRGISSMLAVLVRSQARREGVVSQDRLQSALEELVESEELRAVALLNSSCEIIIQAGSEDIDSQNLPEDGVRWGSGKVTFVNLIDLGANGSPAESIRLNSGGTVVGAYPNLTYECYEREIKAPGKIFLFSDGVFEVRSGDNATWGFDALEQLIFVPPENDLSDPDRIRNEVYRINGRDELEDDYSTVMIAIT